MPILGPDGNPLGRDAAPRGPLPPPAQPSASTPIVQVDASPLVRPGRPRHLRRVVYGGPALGRDVRLRLDRPTLTILAAAAKASDTGRVRVDGVGVVVDLHRGGDGNQFEVWTLTATCDPWPEPSPLAADARPTPRPASDLPPDLAGRPVSTGGGHGHVGRTTYRPQVGEARTFLDRHVVDLCLRRAEASLVGRALLDAVGLVVDVYQGIEGVDAGVRYEVWTLLGTEPRPEPSPVRLAGGGDLRL